LRPVAHKSHCEQFTRRGYGASPWRAQAGGERAVCRELNREPAWVGAIRLALTRGEVTVEGVVREANLRADRQRTVADVLATMADRDLLVAAPDFEASGRYLVGPVLAESAPPPSAVEQLSERAVHQWG